MSKNVCRQGQPGAQKKRRPVQTMKANDLLADQVELSRPVAFEAVVWKANTRQVVRQGIDPHIDDLVGVVRHGNAPPHLTPPDRKILQSCPEQTKYLVSPCFSHHQVRAADQSFERLLIARPTTK